MDKTFHKKSGTTNEGGDYELFNIANISMQLVMDEAVKDFRIASNDEKFGAFDDLVVTTDMENGTETLAIQLKHKNSTKINLLSQLTKAKGDFSITKYFHSVKKLKLSKTKFILFTNLKINIIENTKHYLDGENFSIIATKIEPKLGFNISNKMDHCYKFSIVEDDTRKPKNNSDTDLSYEAFFENFFLYAGQENVHNLKRIVSEKFKAFFGGNAVECDQYVKYLGKWDVEGGEKEKLDKKWIKKAIALNIFSSRIKPLSFNGSKDIKDEIAKRNILLEAIRAFDVTIFQKESYDEIKQLWNNGECELIKVLKKEILQKEVSEKKVLQKELLNEKLLKVVNKLRTKYQLDPDCIPDIDKVKPLMLSILLWLLGKCPLILTYDESVEKAVDLCAGEKLILLKDNSVNFCKKEVSVFETLQDLEEKTEWYDQLVQKFTCSLQGKEEISLEKLIKVDEKIVSVLKTDDLLQMLKSPGVFGISREELPKSYIERFVLKQVIDFKILDNVTKDTVIILDCVQQNNYLKTTSRLKKHTLININVEKEKAQILNIENSNDQKSRMEVSNLNTTIYLSEKPCNYDEFNTIYNEIKNPKNVHQFRLISDLKLEWIRSKGDVGDIEKYKSPEYRSVTERDLDSSEFENNINLLISDPGMGKSALMKSFKIKCFPEYFTVNIDPKDVYSFLKNTHDGDSYVNVFKKFLLDEKNKSLSTRDQAIFRIWLNQNKIIYVWDALDELSDKHRDIVADIIVELSKTSVQWVTSRYHLKNILQKKFNVLALNLNKFNEDEQIKYIQERLSDDKTTKEKIQTIIDKIKSSFALVEHRDILGIPLQLFMLTELLRQDRERYLALLKNLFLLTDLYNYFIEEKMNILYKEKLGIDSNVSSMESLIQTQKAKIFEEYTNAALRLLFPDTILALQHKDIFQKIHETHSNIGLVTEIKDQVPRFVHNSFAEYLAARYFVSKYLQHGDIQTQDLFDPKYNNVRFFFDLLLAEGSQTHINLLYKNFTALKSCESDILTKKDHGGRSVLHLACSWGQRYPEVNVKYVEDNYVIDDDGAFATVPDTREYLETIDYLLEKCDVSGSDAIHKMTPTEYARKTRCRGAEMRITMKERTLNRNSTEIDHIIRILYHSAHHGYHDEFIYFSTELSIPVEQNSVEQENNTTRHKLLSSTVVANIKNNSGMTFLYIAAKMGRVKIVEFLFKAGADINLVHKDGSTPLCIATLYRRSKTVKFLVNEAGADINLPHENGATPLYMASLNGYDEIVEFLLQVGADFNKAGKSGDTPLFVASSKGHLKIVTCLVKNGADINLARKDGLTPLCIACQKGNKKIVDFLLKHGSKVNLANQNGSTPLCMASLHRQGKIVKFLVNKAGADINLPHENGATPLYMASLNGYDEIVEFLLQVGADFNKAGKSGDTPLFVASSNGHLNIVAFLVEAGADINLARKDGLTPLCIACQKGDEKIVDFLLKHGSKVNLANKNGATPLCIASLHKQDKIVKFLVNEAGADVNLPHENGATPLYMASLNGYDKIVEFLLQVGADFNKAGKSGDTPLFVASSNGHLNIVAFLVEAGADINLALEDGLTPLCIACQTGDEKIVDFLLKHGSKVNLANKNGATPLCIASLHKQDKIVKFLVNEAGADVNLPHENGATPLYMASLNGYDKIVEFLLQVGADFNKAGKSGDTPLFVASSNGHLNIVAFLVEAGADINLARKDGLTPLRIASQKGNKKIVEVLSKSKSNIKS